MREDDDPYSNFESGILQFDDPWPRVSVPFPATAEEICGAYCETLVQRCKGMAAMADDPDGELHPPQAEQTRAKGSFFVRSLFPENNDAAQTIPDPANFIPAAYFWQRGARTLGEVDSILRIDADTVRLIDRVMRDGRRLPEIRNGAIRNLKPQEHATWRYLCNEAIETFDACREHADRERWKRFGTTFSELLDEAIAAGSRKWIDDVLSCPFPDKVPGDSGWLCRLLSVAIENWSDCYHNFKTVIRGYENDDIIRLAWPILQAGPFYTDLISEQDAKRNWTGAAKEDFETFESFLEYGRRRKWHEFIERIGATADPGRQPYQVQQRVFISKIRERVTQIVSRLGQPGRAGDCPVTFDRMKKFLDDLAGDLFALERWPRAKKQSKADDWKDYKGLAKLAKMTPNAVASKLSRLGRQIPRGAIGGKNNGATLYLVPVVLPLLCESVKTKVKT